MGCTDFLCFFVFFLSNYRIYFLSVGLLGGLISCFLCLRQVDLKSFVAYSSICHIGFGLGGLYSYNLFGYYGNLFIMISHGFCSSCLFYILYLSYKRFYSRRMLILKGGNYTIPVFGFFCFIFFSLNIGVPPRFSFFSEIFIIISINYVFYYRFCFVLSFLFLAGVYCIYIYVISNHGVNYLESLSLVVFIREYLLL